VAEDWRLTVAFARADRAGRVAQAVRKQWVEDGVRQLGFRVTMSVDGPSLFLYTETEGAAREADRVLREVLAQHQIYAEFALDRWHPVAQEWADASVPMPENDDAWQAERRRAMDFEAGQSRAAGRAAWQVRVALTSHRQTVEFAERLRAEGHTVIRRWKYLALGADHEDEASALAEAIALEAPPGASVQVMGNSLGPGDAGQAAAGEVAALFLYL
jgi:hypothetical protein